MFDRVILGSGVLGCFFFRKTRAGDRVRLKLKKILLVNSSSHNMDSAMVNQSWKEGFIQSPSRSLFHLSWVPPVFCGLFPI